MLGIRTTFGSIGTDWNDLHARLARTSTNAMFHEIFGNSVFSAAKSKNRFKFLIAHISLDDHTTRPTL